MRYKKLGIVKKRKGLQMWEFDFNYGLLNDEETEVFFLVKPKSRRTQRAGDEGSFSASDKSSHQHDDETNE